MQIHVNNVAVASAFCAANLFYIGFRSGNHQPPAGFVPAHDLLGHQLNAASYRVG